MRISGKVIFTRHLTFLVILLLLLSPASASAATRRRASSASGTQRQVESLNKELQGIAKKYNSTLTSFANIERSLRANQKRIAELNIELAKDQEKLNSRLETIYRNGEISIFDVLLGSKNFYQLSSRWIMMRKIAQQDAQLLNSVKRQKAEIEKANESLIAERNQIRSAKKRLATEGAKLRAKLREQQTLLAKSKSNLVASRSGQRIRVSRDGSALPLRGGFIFPVAASHAYSNDWGEPRSGHRHQGTDIFALRGTPVVAVVGGSVAADYSGRAGKMLYLYGSDGNSYEYMHLDGFAVSEGGVSAGQVIGYVGSTGNARGGSPHLHFEIHPGGGGPINPYPILRAAE